jgi:hypothetical protein
LHAKVERQSEMFDTIWVQVGPRALGQVSSLVVVSVAAAVTMALKNNTNDRLDWIDYALNVIDPLVGFRTLTS